VSSMPQVLHRCGPASPALAGDAASCAMGLLKTGTIPSETQISRHMRNVRRWQGKRMHGAVPVLPPPRGRTKSACEYAVLLA